MKIGFAVAFAVSIAAMELGAQSAVAADMSPPPAGPSYQPYISLFAGASFLNNVDTVFSSSGTPYTVKTNMGYLIGGAVGVDWNNMIRTEIELSHSAWTANSYNASGGAFVPASGNISATYLLGNVWLDIQTQSAFTPYVGGGVGVGWANADVSFNGGTGGYGSGVSSALAYQLGAGVKFAISDQLDLDVGYRYKGLGNIDFNDRSGSGFLFNGARLNSHNVQIGLTYRF